MNIITVASKFLNSVKCFYDSQYFTYLSKYNDLLRNETKQMKKCVALECSNGADINLHNSE